MSSDLPSRFSARLDADVYALLAHRILDGDNRHLVRKPDEGEAPVLFRATLDREAGTVRLLDFPPLTERVGTDLGKVTATVSVEGEPVGRYDSATGHVEVEVVLTFDPDHALARTSRVTLVLSSNGRIEQPELEATGDALELVEGTLTLTGHGTFESGTLDGGLIWLALACAIDQMTDEG